MKRITIYKLATEIFGMPDDKIELIENCNITVGKPNPISGIRERYIKTVTITVNNKPVIVSGSHSRWYECYKEVSDELSKILQ